MIERVISGGQTGADRASLDAALEVGVPHGGHCPKGRRAEDGPIPPCYKLKETESSEYPPRTELNVENSDGTVVFTFGPPERGSSLTLRLARKHDKPALHIDLRQLGPRRSEEEVYHWAKQNDIQILNVAGNRESTSPGIAHVVKTIISNLLRRQRNDQICPI